MQPIVLGLLVFALAFPPAFVSAKGAGHSSTGHSSSHSYSSPHSGYEPHSSSTSALTSSHSSSLASTGSTHASGAAVGVTRDAHGHIARSEHAKESFRKTHPCPGTGKTY